MKPETTTLMDVLTPPGNPWLRKILAARGGSVPEGVQVVRFGGRDDADEFDAPPPTARAREMAEA